MTATQETIAAVAREVCLPSVPKLDDFDRPLLDSGLDSLDYASLLMALEEKFDIRFTNQEMEELNTINKIAAEIDALATA